jgi:hypothetical protein
MVGGNEIAHGSPRCRLSAWETLGVTTTLTSAELAALDADALRRLMDRDAMNNSAQRRSVGETWAAAQQPRALEGCEPADPNAHPLSPPPLSAATRNCRSRKLTERTEDTPASPPPPPLRDAGKQAATACPLVTFPARSMNRCSALAEEEDLSSCYRPTDITFFTAVAAMRCLCDEHDDLHVSPPPLWPMVLRTGWCAPPIQVLLHVRPFTQQETARASEEGRPLSPALVVCGRTCAVLGSAPVRGDVTLVAGEPLPNDDETFELDDCVCLAPAEQMPMAIPCVEQCDAYRYYSRQAVTAALQGRDVCIAAYGASRSGKTHALFGPRDFESSPAAFPRTGIVHEVASQLFTGIGTDPLVTVSCAFIDMLNHSPFDLLAVRDDGLPAYSVARMVRNADGVLVLDVTRTAVRDEAALVELVKQSVRCRQRLTTHMNYHEYHRTFVVRIEVTRGADIASEVSPETTAINLVELTAHNLEKRFNPPWPASAMRPVQRSLSAFRHCMDAVAQRWRRHEHVPTRDSPLTWLLNDSLVKRDALRIVLATVSPDDVEREDTVTTLRAVRQWTLGTM